MNPELAAVYVSILPDASKIASGVVAGVQGASPGVESASNGLWGKISAGMTTGLKVGAVAAGAGIAAVLGKSISGGIGRLSSIEQAEAKLTGLKHSAGDVEGIMNNALASVEGTAFGLGDAAGVAASAVAAGIKPGEDLERTLRLTADAATVAGVDFASMGSIFGKVATSNKMQMDVANQLMDAGIPIMDLVAKQMGVTAEEAVAMASAGEVSFETFQAAIEGGMGGAALSAGDTMQGAFANMSLALDKFGAELLSGFYPYLKDTFTNIQSLFKNATAAVGPFAEEMGPKLGAALSTFTGFLAALDFTSLDAFFASTGEAGPVVSSAFSSIGTNMETLAPALKDFAAQVPNLGGALVDLGVGVLPIVAGAIQFLADNVDTIIAWMPVLVAGFVAWSVASRAFTAAQVAQAPVLLASNSLGLARALIDMQVARSSAAATTAQVANTAATSGGMLATVRSTAALVAQRVALVATSVAQRAAAAAQWLFNAALLANPITWIIVGIAALVAGLVWFFTQTELGQAIWTEFTRFLGEAWNNIVAVATTVFTFLGAFFTNVWNGIVTAVQFVWGLIVGYITWYINTVMTIITTVVTAIVTAWNWLWNGIVTVFQFVWNLIVLAVTTYINIVMTIITTILNVITTVWTNIWNGISTVISTVWGWIVTGVTAYITLVQTVITNVVNAISTTWNTVWGAISVFFMSLWDGIVRAVEGFVNEVQGRITQVTNFLQALPEKIMGFFTGIGEWLVESGKSLIQGFLDGISSAFEGAKGFVEDGLGAIRDLFPFSPAKEGPFSGRGWVAYSGLSVGETFGQSVASALNSEKSGVVSALGGIQSEFDSFDGTATASLGVDRFGDVAFARNAQRASYDFAAGEAQFGAGQGGNTTVNVNGDGLPASAVGEVVVQKLANAWR